MKTKSSAKKRFIKTGSGKIKRGSSHRRHILTKKPTKRLRHLRSPAMVHDADMVRMERMLPNG
jgi:large subunit ribosomal protein L35